MGKENILRTFWDYIFEYFALRSIRKVFFFSLLAVLLSAILYRIFESDVILKIFLISCVLAALSTLIDSLQDKAEFVEEIEKLKKSQALRLAKIYGDNQVVQGGKITGMAGETSFEENEKHYIKQKKRQYNYSITVKLIFLAFFIVLLF